MRVTMLGCGTSTGVPRLVSGWGDCDPNEPRNRRLRVAALVESEGIAILIDTPPDLRTQLLACNVSRIDTVLYTHAHGDHAHGIDDLRPFSIERGAALDAYGDQRTMDELEQRFSYIFGDSQKSFYKPVLQTRVITPGSFTVEGMIEVQAFVQQHGSIETLGYRIGDFAYSTDAVHLDDAAFDALAGVKLWIVDCLQMKPHPTHAHLDLTLEWIRRVKPKRAILTHMGPYLDYRTTFNQLPAGVEPGYDGLVVEL